MTTIVNEHNAKQVPICSQQQSSTRKKFSLKQQKNSYILSYIKLLHIGLLEEYGLILQQAIALFEFDGEIFNLCL